MEILAGNELLSGAGVYLDGSGRWGEDLQQARLFGPGDKDVRDAAIAATRATGRIVGVEVEKVRIVDGVVIPERLREHIRSAGPTTPAFDKQHLREGDHVSI
jgi:hypothetical protein